MFLKLPRKFCKNKANHETLYHDPSNGLYAHNKDSLWTFFMSETRAIADSVLCFDGK